MKSISWLLRVGPLRLAKLKWQNCQFDFDHLVFVNVHSSRKDKKENHNNNMQPEKPMA